MPITVRRGEASDLAFMRDMLYEAAAVGWTLGGLTPPPPADVLAHPSNQRYTAGWGRPGDACVIADDGRRAIGSAWYRIFAPDERGDGIMAWPGAPEVSIGVHADARGRGAGGLLLGSLAGIARGEGYPRLVLSVDPRNPARRLYARCGYREVADPGPHAGTSIIMELPL